VLVGIALAAALALFAWQARRAGVLAAEVGRLQGQLAASREDLRAYQQRMSVVRGHVDDLSARIGTLRELVSEDLPSRREAEAD